MKRMAYIVFLLILDQGIAAAGPLSRICDKHYTVIYTETFAGSSNQGRWSFGNGNERIERSGGDPLAYLHNWHLLTFAPRPRTAPGLSSEFSGNFRERGVISLGADLRTYWASQTAEDRPLTLVLSNDAGTPRDPFDDLYVFFVGPKNIPLPGGDREGEWEHYQFAVPAGSRTLPFPRSEGSWQPGWVATVGSMDEPARDPNAVWNRVIQDVDRVMFWFHDPRVFSVLQNWDVGIDNPSIATCFD